MLLTEKKVNLVDLFRLWGGQGKILSNGKVNEGGKGEDTFHNCHQEIRKPLWIVRNPLVDFRMQKKRFRNAGFHFPKSRPSKMHLLLEILVLFLKTHSAKLNRAAAQFNIARVQN
jgi:hypothetical protein